MVAGEVKRVVGLVGKGVTFDSGGYNLKVGGMIDMMKFDMGGAAAVLGAGQALASLQPAGVQVHPCSFSLQSLLRAPELARWWHNLRGNVVLYLAGATWNIQDRLCLHARALPVNFFPLQP